MEECILKNIDKANQKMIDIQNSISAAIEKGDSDAMASGFMNLAKEIENKILTEAKEAVNDNLLDREVMNKRGLNALTAEETKYYNEVIEGNGFAGTEKLLPATVFERVFEELKANHPLLSKIQFTNTTGITEWISRNNDVESAVWGPLTSAITKKLEGSFKKEKTELFKLSAFVPVAKAMLDLGPAWLDKFVREILSESMAIALEKAIVAGTGKDQPIGMIKNLEGAVKNGVYPDKAKVVLPDFKPKTLGAKIMSPLTKDGKRTVNKVLIVVNPLDYWEKIFALTTMLSQSGTYVYGVMPIPADIIQSTAVAKGTMIAGMAKDYFMGVGSTRKVEYSDQYRFLEDERVYLTKQNANGKPKDNKSFLVFDISNLGEEAAE